MALVGASAVCSTRPAALAAPAPIALRVDNRQLEVLGKAATVYGIFGPDGPRGLTVDAEAPFDAVVTNAIAEPTILHWHGQEPPAAEDGNRYYAEIASGDALRYRFQPRAGSHWIHSHHGLQEANLMAAPLIFRTRAARAEDRQEVVLMLHDFSFTPPEEIYANLRARKPDEKAETAEAMPTSEGAGAGGETAPDGTRKTAMKMPDGTPLDLNDVDFDAYLANDRTLDDPEIVPVEAGGRVRLRVVNAASSTNFFLDLGALTGTLVAVDGTACKPVTASRFPLAVAQRLDIALDLDGAGVWPVLAQREGDTVRTGIVLATPGAHVAKVASHAAEAAGPVAASDLERRLTATQPLDTRAADRAFRILLTGDMATYSWGLAVESDGGPGFTVRYGERVALTLVNQTGMAHPMHLHGHHFQVEAIGDDRFAGAIRDTVMVGPRQSVRIAFDAVNPGQWPFHCHIAYHQTAGMITKLDYVG